LPRAQLPLLISVFLIAACGLAYELIAAALASYLLGDSVTQFSTIIGSYLFAMGIGSWLSKYVPDEALVPTFVRVEILVGLLGGLAAAGLFLAFAASLGPFRILLYATVLLIGMLVGIEIPLVMRLLRREMAFDELVARVLSFDYLGALAVSLIFPLFFVPHLGLMRSGMAFGLINAAVALWALWLFRHRLRHRPGLHVAAWASLLLLVASFVGAGRLSALAESWLYAEDIIHAETTPYQRLVITRWRDDVRLYLNQNLQFSSRDEYRYHEALVHPVLASLPQARRALVLGGGDGLAVREILKYPAIESVTLVDLDPAMTRLFAQAPLLRALNADALNSPRVQVINRDAARWLEECDTASPGVAAAESQLGEHGVCFFDFIVVDFPDPSSYAIGKLYSTAFYRLLSRRLAERGALVVQATSPYYARRSYWTVVATLEAVGLQTAPYHAHVPSFGDWGFIAASRQPYRPPARYDVALRFLTAETTRALFDFPADMARLDLPPNRPDEQSLVRLFEQEWRQALR